MATPALDPTERLCEEILREGRRQAEEIREAAHKEGEAHLAKATAELEQYRLEAQENSRLEAARARERILADVPLEIARFRASRIEDLLEGLRREALQCLRNRQGFDYREALISLAVEALGEMSGETVSLALAPGEEFPGLVEEILRRTGRPGLSLSLVEDPEIVGGGLILRDLEGRQVWDDRLAVRLERLWPALRLSVARGTGLLGEP